MKNIGKILRNFSFSMIAGANILSADAQYPEKENYPKNSFELSAGRQMWNDPLLKENYIDVILFEGAYYRGFSKKSKFGISLDYGSITKGKEKEIQIGLITINPVLKYTSVNLGMKTNLFESEDGMAKIYLNGKVKKIFVYERFKHLFEEYKKNSSDYDKENSTLGYYCGAGVDAKISKRFSGFFEAGWSDGKIPFYDSRLRIGGAKITLGGRLTPSTK